MVNIVTSCHCSRVLADHKYWLQDHYYECRNVMQTEVQPNYMHLDISLFIGFATDTNIWSYCFHAALLSLQHQQVHFYRDHYNMPPDAGTDQLTHNERCIASIPMPFGCRDKVTMCLDWRRERGVQYRSEQVLRETLQSKGNWID